MGKYGTLKDMSGHIIANWKENLIYDASNRLLGYIRKDKVYNENHQCVGNLSIYLIKNDAVVPYTIGYLDGIYILDRNKNKIGYTTDDIEKGAAAAILTKQLNQTDEAAQISSKGRDNDLSSYDSGESEIGVGIALVFIFIAFFGVFFFIYNANVVNAMFSILDPSLERNTVFQVLSCVAIGAVGIMSGHKLQLSAGYGIGLALLSMTVFAFCMMEYENPFMFVLEVFSFLLMIVFLSVLTLIGLGIVIVIKVIYESILGDFKNFIDLCAPKKVTVMRWVRYVSVLIAIVLFYNYANYVWDAIQGLAERHTDIRIIDGPHIYNIAKTSALIAAVPILIFPRKYWDFSGIVGIALALLVSQISYRLNYYVADTIFGTRLIMNCLLLALYLPVPLGIAYLARKFIIDKLLRQL